MRKIFKVIVLLCALAGASLPVWAQTEVPPPASAYQPLGDAQLDQLLGPIALYPDPLVAEILPASTFPTEIVTADRYVTGGGDPNQIDQQPWDPSVQALARYPQVLQWMDQNLDWTTELGQAFLNQQQDVMDSVQRLRQSAYNLGNLESTPQQQVVDDGGDIEILPADPQQIYVPVYQPDDVYYQSGYGLTFGAGFPIGVWLGCDFDWHNHNLIVWGGGHPRPANWWHERPDQRDAVLANHPNVWHGSNHSAGIIAIRGDRGWGVPQNHASVVTVGRSMSDSVMPRRTPEPAARPEAPVTRSSMPVARPTPAPVQHFEPAGNPPSSGAFVGIQSARDTRNYSARGQESVQTMNHSEPASRPAPSSNGGSHSGGGGGGGGGGSHGSSSKH
jgi:uncharacterized membrane protein YgcG